MTNDPGATATPTTLYVPPPPTGLQRAVRDDFDRLENMVRGLTDCDARRVAVARLRESREWAVSAAGRVER